MGKKKEAWIRWVNQARKDHVGESHMGVAENAFRYGWNAAMKAEERKGI